MFALNWKHIPADTTVREIIQNTSSAELEDCFRAYSADLAKQDTPQQWVGFDGKVLRGSFDHFRDQKAIQVLSPFVGSSRIILAHAEIAKKTHEIPTAQDLIVKNEAITQVKENQRTLFNDCQAIAQTTAPQEVYQEPTTKTRNRIERRTVAVFSPVKLTHADKWSLVKAIVKVERYRLLLDTKTKEWQPRHETSFYISTTVLSAQQFCQGIRGHWQIENGDHHVRDVTLAEDQSRIRINPHIFAQLHSFALNILRVNHVENVSQALFGNCMNLNNVLNYVGVR